MEEEPRLIRLPSVPHPFGELVVAEGGALPFVPRRTYFVHGIPAGATRGGHAHRRTREAIIPLRGSFRVSVARQRGNAGVFLLSDPRDALLIPALWWVVLDEFSEGAAFLVVASEPYDEADYIRDRSAFEGLGAGGRAG